MPKTTCNHCDDYTRAGLLRQGFATAGRGLPSIEPGMPTPAGTGMNRRSMLLRSAGLAMTVFGARALAPNAFEFGVQQAAAAAPNDPILVSVFMSGGVDSLTVLAPVDDPIYVASRPNLRVAKSVNPLDVFLEDTRLQWHPGAAPLRDLHREGKVSVMPGIGWSSDNGSHFHSRHFWEVGEIDLGGRTGWMGRYLDREGSADNPLQGLSLNQYLSPSLASASSPVAAVSKPELFQVDWAVGGANFLDPARAAYRAMGTSAAGENEATRSARRAALGVSVMEQQLASMRGGSPPYQNVVTYPEGGPHAFPKQLASLAQMIQMGLPLRCVALEANGGYDTHAEQNGSLPDNLSLACRSLAAFQRDLEARGLADRVLIHVWTEFGRRVKENGTGTDHGAGGIGFIIGKHAKGRMVGEFPGLAQQDYLGNLRTTVDFRAVYCSLLEQWLGTDAAGIIPNASSFARPQLVA